MSLALCDEVQQTDQYYCPVYLLNAPIEFELNYRFLVVDGDLLDITFRIGCRCYQLIRSVALHADIESAALLRCVPDGRPGIGVGLHRDLSRNTLALRIEDLPGDPAFMDLCMGVHVVLLTT